jgi:ferredoxin--NADP+ reductase
MLEDVERGAALSPTSPDPAAAEALVRTRQPDVVTYEDWERLDSIETSRGEQSGRPRVKFCSRAEMQEALSKAPR